MSKRKNSKQEETGVRTDLIEQDVASEFIHKLSHDITGIAHNIIGFSTLLEDEMNPEYIKGINKQVAKLKERIQQAVATVDGGSLINQEPD